MNTLYTDIQKLVQDHCDAVVCVNGSMLARDLRGLLEKHAPGQDPDLNELERLRKEGTQGKWEVGEGGASNRAYVSSAQGHICSLTSRKHRVQYGYETKARTVEQMQTDAALIAAAVNALPGLIERVRELEKLHSHACQCIDDCHTALLCVEQGDDSKVEDARKGCLYFDSTWGAP